MNKRSKRYRALQGLYDASKSYSVSEVVALLKKTGNTKFDAGVELHLRLGIDPKKADQLVRGSVVLPHGTGKMKKIAVFCETADQKKAKDAGAELVGGDELISEIKKTGKCSFDIALATPEMMKKMGQIAKILGPKGLMPNPRNETVVKDISLGVKALAGGKIAFRNDDSGNIHQLVGRISFTEKQLEENLATFIEAIRSNRPATAKGTYLKTVSACTTMGPGIKVTA